MWAPVSLGLGENSVSPPQPGVTRRLALRSHTGCATGYSSASTYSAALLTSSLLKEHTGHHTPQGTPSHVWWAHERGQSNASRSLTRACTCPRGCSTASLPGSSRRKLPRLATNSKQRRNLIFLSHNRGVLFQLLCHLLYHLGHLIHLLGSQFQICELVLLPSAEKGDPVQASCQLQSCAHFTGRKWRLGKFG